MNNAGTILLVYWKGYYPQNTAEETLLYFDFFPLSLKTLCCHSVVRYRVAVQTFILFKLSFAYVVFLKNKCNTVVLHYNDMSSTVLKLK